jgi:hypothetical protein
LSTVYKIPKSASSTTVNNQDDFYSIRPVKRVRLDDFVYDEPIFRLPLIVPAVTTEKPTSVVVPKPSETWVASPSSIWHSRTAEEQKKDVAAIIAAATAKAEKEREEAEKLRVEEEAERALKEKKEQERRERKKLPKPSAEEKELLKEKRLLKLVGAIVVACLSKHKAQMDNEQFKKHAKEVRCLRR